MPRTAPAWTREAGLSRLIKNAPTEPNALYRAVPDRAKRTLDTGRRHKRIVLRLIELKWLFFLDLSMVDRRLHDIQKLRVSISIGRPAGPPSAVSRSRDGARWPRRRPAQPRLRSE